MLFNTAPSSGTSCAVRGCSLLSLLPSVLVPLLLLLLLLLLRPFLNKQHGGSVPTNNTFTQQLHPS